MFLNYSGAFCRSYSSDPLKSRVRKLGSLALTKSARASYQNLEL
jgi:hypothetical protein